MTGFVMFLHALLSVLLVVVILMQAGRGGGLTEQFASAESMFGAQTNEFMIKATTVFAALFFFTSLGLAVLSAQKGKSLLAGTATSEELIPIDETTITPTGTEDAVVDVQPQRPDVAPMPIETGAEETLGAPVKSGVTPAAGEATKTAVDAVPFATKPNSAPEVESPAQNTLPVETAPGK